MYRHCDNIKRKKIRDSYDFDHIDSINVNKYEGFKQPRNNFIRN